MSIAIDIVRGRNAETDRLIELAAAIRPTVLLPIGGNTYVFSNPTDFCIAFKAFIDTYAEAETKYRFLSSCLFTPSRTSGETFEVCLKYAPGFTSARLSDNNDACLVKRTNELVLRYMVGWCSTRENSNVEYLRNLIVTYHNTFSTGQLPLMASPFDFGWMANTHADSVLLNELTEKVHLHARGLYGDGRTPTTPRTATATVIPTPTEIAIVTPTLITPNMPETEVVSIVQREPKIKNFPLVGNSSTSMGEIINHLKSYKRKVSIYLASEIEDEETLKPSADILNIVICDTYNDVKLVNEPKSLAGLFSMPLNGNTPMPIKGINVENTRWIMPNPYSACPLAALINNTLVIYACPILNDWNEYVSRLLFSVILNFKAAISGKRLTVAPPHMFLFLRNGITKFSRTKDLFEMLYTEYASKFDSNNAGFVIYGHPIVTETVPALPVSVDFEPAYGNVTKFIISTSPTLVNEVFTKLVLPEAEGKTMEFENFFGENQFTSFSKAPKCVPLLSLDSSNKPIGFATKTILQLNIKKFHSIVGLEKNVKAIGTLASYYYNMLSSIKDLDEYFAVIEAKKKKEAEAMFIAIYVKQVTAHRDTMKAKHTTLQRDITNCQNQLTTLIAEAQGLEIIFDKTVDIAKEAKDKAAKEITRIQANKHIESIDIMTNRGETLLAINTKSIVVQDPRTKFHHLVGKLYVKVRLDPGNFRLTFTNLTHRVDGMQEKMHGPHIFTDGNPCLGSISRVLPELVGAGEYVLAVDTIIQFCQSVNVADAAGKYVLCWPLIKNMETLETYSKTEAKTIIKEKNAALVSELWR